MGVPLVISSKDLISMALTKGFSIGPCKNLMLSSPSLTVIGKDSMPAVRCPNSVIISRLALTTLPSISISKILSPTLLVATSELHKYRFTIKS